MHITSQIKNAMRAVGITAPKEIIASGNLHRFSSNGKLGDNAGWYIGFKAVK